MGRWQHNLLKFHRMNSFYMIFTHQFLNNSTRNVRQTSIILLVGKAFMFRNLNMQNSDKHKVRFCNIRLIQISPAKWDASYFCNFVCSASMHLSQGYNIPEFLKYKPWFIHNFCKQNITYGLYTSADMNIFFNRRATNLVLLITFLLNTAKGHQKYADRIVLHFGPS